MREVIDSFREEYYFLSNFYSFPVLYNGILYLNNEAVFQAQKCPSRAKEFKNLDASAAKRLGRSVNLRSDWEEVKDEIMYQICLIKFTSNNYLRLQLLSTYPKILIEGNTWRDTYWGMCNGIGKNKLGLILMRIREELLEESSKYAKDSFKRGDGIYE